jgi:hypothetical protein
MNGMNLPNSKGYRAAIYQIFPTENPVLADVNSCLAAVSSRVTHWHAISIQINVGLVRESRDFAPSDFP